MFSNEDIQRAVVAARGIRTKSATDTRANLETLYLKLESKLSTDAQREVLRRSALGKLLRPELQAP